MFSADSSLGTFHLRLSLSTTSSAVSLMNVRARRFNEPYQVTLNLRCTDLYAGV